MKVYPVLHKISYNLEKRSVDVLALHTSWSTASKHYRGLRDVAGALTPDGAVTKVVTPIVLGTLDIPLNKTGLLFVSELYNSLAHLGFDVFVEKYNALTAEYATEAGDD